MKKLFLFSLIVGLLLAGLAAGWFYIQTGAVHAPQQSVELMIPKGAGAIKIAQLLEQHDVIISSRAFRLKVRLDGSGGRLRSGLYRFDQPATMAQIIVRLEQGDIMHFQVTVPEGLRTDEVLHLLAEKTGTSLSDWKAAIKTILQADTEGRLLPETYQYTKPVRIEQMLKSMVDGQRKILAELSSDTVVQNKLRIMASIIEKETMIAKERPLVAAVIRNRLQKGMPLQMDPTVIYGIWKTTGSFSGNIHKKDLSTDTPWSTYTRKGLPPTPISNPGAASLRAAAAPAKVPFLYFVADGSGGHQFAATLADHQANVARWVRMERQRQNKRK
ncbi:MAG: endolytic transglycosylase MltG [Mariprofundus sp.]|nr:endolytic transglycosylase MltG [Mariprofundus sp.]